MALFVLLSVSTSALSTNINDYSKTLSWVKVVGSRYEDYNVDAFFDINSSIHIIGEVPLDGSTPQILIIKLNPEGDLRWAKTIDIKNVDVLAIVPFIRVDPKGYIYIAGRVSPSPFNISSPDIFVAKLNQVGEVLWAKVIDLQEPECVEGMYIDASGFIYIVGATRYDIACLVGYAPCYIDFSYINIFIVKIDPEGNIVWIKSLDSGGYDVVNSIIVDSLGYIYLGGTTNIRGEWMYLVVKLNPSGDIVWVKTIDVGGFEYARSMYMDSAQQLHLHGITYINESMYFIIIKLNTKGDFIKGKIIPYAGVAYTTYNGITYLAGVILSDTFLMKLDYDLNLVWVKIIYNPKIELPITLYVDNNNVYVVSSIISQVTQDVYKFEDILIVKLQENTTIPRVIDITEDLYITIHNLDAINIANFFINVSNSRYRVGDLAPEVKDFTNNITVKVLSTIQETPTITLTVTHTLSIAIPTTTLTTTLTTITTTEIIPIAFTATKTIETTVYRTSTLTTSYITTYITTHVAIEIITSKEIQTTTSICTVTVKEIATKTYTHTYRESIYLTIIKIVEKTNTKDLFLGLHSTLIGLMVCVSIIVIGFIYIKRRRL